MQLSIFEQEIWKDIPNYEGLYQTSIDGKIKHLACIINSRWGTNNYPKKEKRLKLSLDRYGYCFLHLSKYGKRKKCLVHRIVALTFIPNPDNKATVNHKNGIKTDNKVENLEWATNRENMLHGYATGLIKNDGTNNGRAKINQQIANQIRDEHKNGLTFLQLAKRYNIGSTTVGHIIHKRTWNY